MIKDSGLLIKSSHRERAETALFSFEELGELGDCIRL